MQVRARVLAALVAGAASFAGTSVAVAQDYPAESYAMPGVATGKVGQAEISVGGGVSSIYLPDVRFGTLASGGGDTIRRFKNSDDFGDEYGGGFSGELLVPWGGSTAVALGGFWSGIEQKDALRCRATGTRSCEVSSLTGANFSGGVGDDLVERAKREVDHWGTQLEGRYYLQGEAGNSFVNTTYVALGGDIREINQDTTINFNGGGGGLPGSYDENLDTSYYGAYLALGGEYKLPFFGDMSSGLGLESGFKGFVGVYGAESDYNGSIGGNSLGMSSDDTAIIAGLTLETRKRFTPRTSVSLVSSYEYYSWVPEMDYSDSGSGRDTRIGDDDAFATRTMLRLNVGLGPDGLYYK